LNIDCRKRKTKKKGNQYTSDTGTARQPISTSRKVTKRRLGAVIINTIVIKSVTKTIDQLLSPDVLFVSILY
jgi:hypothetical protein